MDPVPTPPVSGMNITHTPDRSSRLLYIALATGLVASLIVAACWYIQRGGVSLFEGTPDLVLTSDGTPLLAAMTVDVKGKSLKPLMVEGQGEAVIVDYAKGVESSYYLLSGDGLKTSNLYVSNQTGNTRGLQQITVSPNVKASLSFDSQSNIAAYEVVQADESSVITVWQLGTTTERALVAGNNPVVLSGGLYLTYDDGEKLYSVQIGTGESHKLLTLPKYASYAVDAKKMEVVVFDPLRKEYQYFSLVNPTGASFERMELSDSGSQGRLLSLSDGRLTEVRLSEGGLILVTSGNEPFTLPDSLEYRGGKIMNFHD